MYEYTHILAARVSYRRPATHTCPAGCVTRRNHLFALRFNLLFLYSTLRICIINNDASFIVTWHGRNVVHFVHQKDELNYLNGAKLKTLKICQTQHLKHSFI